MNYTDAETPFTRITEHKYFSNSDCAKTIITREYPAKLGEPYYPVNDSKNTVLHNKYLELAETEANIRFCGRLGEYKYYDMDDVILAALMLARVEVH